MWARIFYFVFCRFRRAPGSSTVPYKWNQARRSSEVYRWIGTQYSLNHCTLALITFGCFAWCTFLPQILFPSLLVYLCNSFLPWYWLYRGNIMSVSIGQMFKLSPDTLYQYQLQEIIQRLMPSRRLEGPRISQGELMENWLGIDTALIRPYLT